MNQIKLQHGYIYAVSSENDPTFTINPHVCIEAGDEFRFISATLLGLDLQFDGPHPLTAEAIAFAGRHGIDVSPDDVWSLWSKREPVERVAELSAKQGQDSSAVASPIGDHPVVIEAERILREQATPDGKASTWLRNSEHWSGSSVSVLRDPNGQLSDALISLHTSNPYVLRSLLRWLGVPRSIVMQVTGLER